MKLKAVIFDWAGTMVDFGSRAPVKAMQAGFRAEGVEISEALVRAGMGLAKRDHVALILASDEGAAAWRATHVREATGSDIDRIFEALGPLMRDAGAAHADLIPGAAETACFLAARGLRIGSTTGYTRDMMAPILVSAASQGYAPESVICAGETKIGRPSPLMIWKTLVEFGVWPAGAVLKVDDAPVGIEEGVAAGCISVGVAASGNALGLPYAEYAALPDGEREARLAPARESLLAAGASFVIDTVAELVPELVRRGLIEG
jgi:phosphonoacetaldehyde hydrolase